MLKSAIDHIVVTASSREAGVAFVSDIFGVSPVAGGEHPRMGTHNALLRLGDALYLEVISINPEAPPPGRPRWFGLEDLSPSAPRLAAWVVRTTDICDAVKRSPLVLGQVEPMTRDSLRWQITIPPDGKPLLDGAVPSLIQWSSPVHPAVGLPDVGCALEGLEIRHSQAGLVQTLLQEIGFEGPLTVSSGRPALCARIRTPKGLCVLGES
ncbi:MAG TPA: VOC family protein [Candidatus Eisenbacteria bacterium]|nr:VOC family protein [Candidatus Eisenbacteria bacterium]